MTGGQNKELRIMKEVHLSLGQSYLAWASHLWSETATTMNFFNWKTTQLEWKKCKYKHERKSKDKHFVCMSLYVRFFAFLYDR